MALNNSQYDTIMRSYEQKQLHSQDRLFRHYEEIYRKIPEIKEIDDSISSLSVEKAKLLLNGERSALDSLKTQLHDMFVRKQTLLLDHGYPAGYLEPEYECPDCHDTGYIDGKKCHCFQKAAIQLLYKQSNLSEILKEENFAHLSYSYYSDSHIDAKTGQSALAMIKHAVTVCHDFVGTFSSDFRNLFFYGDTGVGKTFLSHCIAAQLIERAYSVLYFSAFELFDIFAKSRFGRDSEAADMNEHIFDCDLLIIDDLGTELSNSFTSSQLFLCVNERLLRKKSTIISTNLSFDSLVDLYTERTFSRITSNYTMLKLTGDDIRIQKKLMNREANQ